MGKCLVMCRCFENKIEEDPDFLDEAHFWHCAHVNSNNCVYWGTEAPDEMLQRPLHSVKCTAWMAISRYGIIGIVMVRKRRRRGSHCHKRSITLMCWISSRRHLEHVVVWIEMCKSSNKIRQLHILPTLLWIDSSIGWSAGVANLIWASKIFTSWGSWRTTCVRTIHNPLLNSKWPSIRRFVPYRKKRALDECTFSNASNQCFFKNSYYISFQDMQSFFGVSCLSNKSLSY